MDVGGVPVVDRAEHARDLHPRVGLLFVEALDPIAQAEADKLLVAAIDRRQLLRPARNRHRAAALEVDIDALRRRGATDFVDRARHRAIERHRFVAAVMLRDMAQARWEMRRAPRAVAAGGAVARDLGFDDRNLQRRLTLVKVEGGPQTGIAGTQDRDIDIDRAVERRPRRQVVAAGLEPETGESVVLHKRDTSNAQPLDAAPFSRRPSGSQANASMLRPPPSAPARQWRGRARPRHLRRRR